MAESLENNRLFLIQNNNLFTTPVLSSTQQHQENSKTQKPKAKNEKTLSKMSTTKKTIAVIGSTGGQGGSVVKSILADATMRSTWAVRGISRDVTKESSKKLAAQGAEVDAVSNPFQLYPRKILMRYRPMSTPRRAY